MRRSIGPMNDTDDLLDNLFIDALLKDADQLISGLGIDVANVPTYGYGSQRFRSVANMYDRLAYAEKRSGKRWERAQANDRSGQFLMEELWGIRGQLATMDEGVPRPKS